MLIQGKNDLLKCLFRGKKINLESNFKSFLFVFLQNDIKPKESSQLWCLYNRSSWVSGQRGQNRPTLPEVAVTLQTSTLRWQGKKDKKALS